MDAAKRIEDEQIGIAGDDEIGAGRERAGEHMIVIRIARGGSKRFQGR